MDGTLFGRGLRALSVASVVAIGDRAGAVFFYAPIDADQGFIQKIFYVHVPLAIVALIGFVVAGGVRDRSTCERATRATTTRSYVAIHMSVIFGVAVLVTGSIWAKGSWGKWWVWDEPTLVSFLIVFLLYVTYYPLRYSIEDPERRARYSSVFAITAGAFVPINFIAVRLSESLVHPRVLSATGGSMPGEMRLTFLVVAARHRAALRHAGEARADREARPHAAEGAAARCSRREDAERSPASSPLATVPAKPE